MDTVPMETGSSEEAAGTKALSPGCGELAGGGQTQGAAVLAPYDCTDVTDTEQSSGKAKKTAFKLFGGRKSICTLPSFFTIKNKGQVKGFSKKGLIKSKTLNGISEVALDINKKEGIDPVWSGYNHSSSWSSAASRTLRASKSENSALDNNVNSDFHKCESIESENSECFAHKRSTDKPSSERRSKKGLRGLFNSIRRHKKNKDVESSKTDPQGSNHAAADGFAHSEQPTAREQGVGVEFKKGMVELNLKPSCKMNCIGIGDSADEIGTENRASFSSESCAIKFEKPLRNKRNEFETSGTEVRKINVGESKALNRKPSGAIPNLNSSFGSMPDIVKTDCMDHDPPSVHSFDQVSMIFGDVTSMKSFDSLTGCGDIIADHDDDSIPESTVSGERRTAGKRSSCLVTYQGGGEEMATPDEVEDEYLKGLWEKTTEAATVFDSSQDIAEDGGECLRSPSEVEHSSLHINLLDPCALRGITDSAINSSELVTPQSDHQESAPNSDEGYYDSTTPGHDEEGGDSISETKNERLPRDSYSGDALYELFEQNDSLINSPPSDEHSLETKPPLGASLTSILSFSLPVDTCFPCIPSKQSIMIPSEQERFNFIQEDEIRLAHLQQQLTCWESNGKIMFLKDSSVAEKENFSGDLLETEFSKISTDAVGVSAKNQQTAVSTEPLVSSSLNRSAKMKAEHTPETADGQNWTKLQRLCPKETDNGYMTYKQSMCESYSTSKLHNNVSGASNVQEYKNDNCGKWGQQMKHREDQSMINIIQNGAGANDVIADLSGSSSDYKDVGKAKEKFEQAISYSQALVEFTANRKLYPNLSESLGSSDSGSQQTEGMHALPAMVTFDVVDVENEEECDQQSEMVMDEEISASYEAFDNGYLEKGPYHHCDERMFQSCAQNSSLGACWGAASLPRHSSLYKRNPSLPAPLSLSRRSRSLDTDSLESELTDLYLSKVTAASKSTPQSPNVPPYEWDGRKASAYHWFGKRSGQMVYLETPDIAYDLHCSGQQLAKCRQEPVPLAKRNATFNSFCPSATDLGKLHTNQTGDLSLHCKSNSVKQTSQNQSTSKGNLEPVIKNKMPQISRKLVRPSHLPLQNDDFVLQTSSSNSTRENTTGNRALLSLNERGEEDFCQIASLAQYSNSEPELVVKARGPAEIPRVQSPFFFNKTNSEAQPGSYWMPYSCQ